MKTETAYFVGLLGLDEVNHGCSEGLARVEMSSAEVLIAVWGLVKEHSQQMKGFLSYTHKLLQEVFVFVTIRPSSNLL